MKFSNIILATTCSILLMDTGLVQGQPGRGRGRGRGRGEGRGGRGGGRGRGNGNNNNIDNKCDALDPTGNEEVGKKVCVQTLECEVNENEVCITFVPTACGDITDPTRKDCGKNGCLFVEGAEGADTCEVDPCIAKCVDQDNDTCCLRSCQCSRYNWKRCKTNSNCAVDNDTEVCTLKSAGDTPFDKCSKANSNQERCEKKNKCVYDSGTNVCSRAVVGCYAFNGQEPACAAAEEGCVYDDCTEQCSKE